MSNKGLSDIADVTMICIGLYFGFTYGFTWWLDALVVASFIKWIFEHEIAAVTLPGIEACMDEEEITYEREMRDMDMQIKKEELEQQKATTEMLRKSAANVTIKPEDLQKL